MNGWCIQGFITGVILTALVLLVALDEPIGLFLDVRTPDLLVAILVQGSAGVALLIAAMATYTLMRQGILDLRAELRKTRHGGLVTWPLQHLYLSQHSYCSLL